MKKSVTICIPAYNEQQNIDNVLKQIFAQEQENYYINKVIVASDGSTDSTAKIAREYVHLGVEVIEGTDNKGQTYRQNEMISKASSDILVLLNADLHLGDNEVISKLIKPILNGADLTAQWAKPFFPSSFLERVLHAGFEMKYFAYTRLKAGNNIYTCVGHIRALSKKFYSLVRFPTVSEGEDQYLYLLCKQKGFQYKYVDSNNLYFKLPGNFSDYKKYAKRIFQTQQKYEDVFTKELVNTEHKIPPLLQVQAFFHGIISNPFYSLIYALLHVIIQQWSLRQPNNPTNTFEISSSTKTF